MWTVIAFVTASLLQCVAGQVSPANTTSFCLDTRGTFCVQAAPTADPAVYRVSLQSSYTGWVGVGFGSSRMSGNAPTYIAWNNGNSVVVSLRRTSSKNTPTFLNAVTAQKDASSASGGISASFDVPAATLGLGKGSLNCMYGMSNRGPSTASSASSNFPEHSKYGSFVLNFGGQTGGSASNNAITTAAGPGQSISSYCFDSQNSFCAVALRDTSTNVITFTLYSSAAGWISIGTGSSMSGSTMFVGWKNGANVLVSQWRGSGHNVSPTTSGSVLTTVANPAIVTIPSTATIAFSFTVPVSSNLISTTSSSNFIFGISNQPPNTPSSPSSSFPQHSVYSSFSLDVSKLGTTTTAGGSGNGGSSDDDAISLVLIHGISMFIAWSVLPPIAIFIARYMKDRMGHNWYLSHKWIMLGGVGIFTIIGIVSVEWNLNPADSVLRFIGSSNHGIIGTVVALIVYPLQVILGEVSNALWSAERKSIPWWDKAHWWLGRAVVVLAIVNTYLGLVEYGAKVIWIVGYWVWIAVVVFVGFGYFGEVQMGGVVHHVATDSSEEMVVVNPTR